MTIREPGGPVSGPENGLASPGELRLATSLLPGVGDSPSLPAAASSTPGATSSVARYPGSPTLPDMDPVSLTSLVSRLANDLFAMPTLGGPASSLAPSLDAPASPTVSAPAPPAAIPSSSSPSPSPSLGGPAAMTSASSAPSAMPSTLSADTLPVSGSPFDAPLDFTAFEGAERAFQAPAALAFPLLDATDLAAAPHEAAAPRVTAPLDFASLEQAPTPNADLTFPSHASGVPSDLTNASFTGGSLDAHALKREFPILKERVNGRQLVWLDNAATTQKPQAVIDRLKRFYEHENSNIHRAAHTLAARATDAYEKARESVRRFLNAPSAAEIVFVRGATEGINLIAQSWGRRNIEAGDEIVISWLEHHANIVPWQQLCLERGARLRVAPVDDRGQVLLEEYEKLLNDKTKLVSFTQVSNALGTITPAKAMIDMAHRHGALVLLDGAQAVSHKPVDVQALDCDFYVFSGHKVFAPTGIGAVFGKKDILDAMPPWQGGGNMIQDVTFERTRFHPAPMRFEAGTGNIADAVGLGEALDWLTRVGIERVERYEHELLVYGTECLKTVPGLTLVGTAAEKAGVLSFILAGQKTEEVGGLLDKEGIAVRSGHHCAQPILRRFGLEATVRASLAPYNTKEDIDALVAALERIQAGRARA